MAQQEPLAADNSHTPHCRDYNRSYPTHRYISQHVAEHVD